MALYDILFTDGDPQNIILELEAGTSNSPDDILTECCSNSGMMEYKLTLAGGARSFAF